MLNEAQRAALDGKYAEAQGFIDQVQTLGVAGQEEIARRIKDVRVLQAQQLLNKAEGAIRSRDYPAAQGFIDQVKALGVAEQEEIARRIAAVNMLKGQGLLDRAESAYRNAVWDAAFDLVAQVKQMSEAGQSPLKEGVESLEKKLAPHEEEIQKKKEEELAAQRTREEAVAAMVVSIESSINARRLNAARERLHTLPEEARKQPNVVEFTQKIDAGMSQADALVRQARAAAANADRVALCLRALTICLDHPAAQEMLKSTPPPPPAHVRATATTSATLDSVRIVWDASDEEGVSYYVLRKADAQPLTPQDGAMIARDVTERAFLDNHPPIGVKLYYAVFAKRKQADGFSASASAPDPIVLAKDVLQARAEPGDRSVTLTWKAPERASITIRRREGTAPTSATDGESVRPNSPSSALDGGLTNGTVYYYRISCVFAGDVVSSGVTVSATPHTRPAFPPPLAISGPAQSCQLVRCGTAMGR